jgi:FGGY family of carbohydrate kinases, C-terminal domain
MDLNNTSSMGGRLRSASLDLLRSASLDLLKSSSISLLKCVANSSNSASDSVAQHLKVGGGMTSNNLLMQFQADLLGLSLYRPYVRTVSKDIVIFFFSSLLLFIFSSFLLLFDVSCFLFFFSLLLLPCTIPLLYCLALNLIICICLSSTSIPHYDMLNIFDLSFLA